MPSVTIKCALMNPSEIKILLVDDEPDILELVGFHLRKEGYTVFTASGGKEGVEIARREQPALIILDVMMPDMDGMETCEKIRQIPQLKDTLVTFLTALAEDYSMMAGFDAGADDYITKPVKPKVLVSKIKALLRRAGGQDSAGGNESGGGRLGDRPRQICGGEQRPGDSPAEEGVRTSFPSHLASRQGVQKGRDNGYRMGKRGGRWRPYDRCAYTQTARKDRRGLF